jgi:hypothetical protein
MRPWFISLCSSILKHRLPGFGSSVRNPSYLDLGQSRILHELSFSSGCFSLLFLSRRSVITSGIDKLDVSSRYYLHGRF